MVLPVQGSNSSNTENDNADDAAGNAAKLGANTTTTGNDAATSCGVPTTTTNSATAGLSSSSRQSCYPPSSSQKQQEQKRRQSSLWMQRMHSSSRRSKILLRQSSKSFHALLLRKSSNLMESIIHQQCHLLPSSPTEWSLLALSLASLGLQYELQLQKQLTASPIVFCQTSTTSGATSRCRSVLNSKMDRLFRIMLIGNSNYNNDDDDEEDISVAKNNGRSSNGSGGGGGGIFARKVTPSFIIGTRGIMSSVAAYASGGDDEAGGRWKNRGAKRAAVLREVMKMGADGARIVLDWEIPISRNTSPPDPACDDTSIERPPEPPPSSSNEPCSSSVTMPNSIDKPVILLVHGMNNDSSFGYIRSMMRTATDRGWIAVCMNLRGQDGGRQVKNTTPRGYTAGYTGDLRGVVQQIQHRLRRKEKVTGRNNHDDQPNNTTERNDPDEEDLYIGGPIFLLGYSLGANIITKYLGEESLHGTLPKCIGGGAAMGNPLHIHSGSIRFPWNVVLGAGVKKSILQNFDVYQRHHDPGFQSRFQRALFFRSTIGALDDAVAPYILRNDSHPPYAPRIGYKDGNEYWWDSSSHRYVAHVSVPLLKISAQDDFLVFGQFSKKLNHCMENPNVLVVKTRCGGHLGWQECPPPCSKDGKRTVSSLLRGSGSWSDVAVADFIEAVLQLREEDRRMEEGRSRERNGNVVGQFSPPPPRILSKL